MEGFLLGILCLEDKDLQDDFCNSSSENPKFPLGFRTGHPEKHLVQIDEQSEVQKVHVSDTWL